MTDHLKVLGGDVVPSLDIDGLRERAALGLERALGFVEQHGSALSKLRAHIMVGIEPVSQGLACLADQQTPAGSILNVGQVFSGPITRNLLAFDPEGEIRGTLEALSVLADWSHLYDAPCDRAVEFLYRAQQADGGYGGASEGSVDSPERVFTTGMLAGFLGRTRSVRPETLTAAGLYMNRFWSVDYIRQNAWPSVASFTHYFTNVHDEEGEAALPWCARELERGGLVGEYSASEQLRVLFYCEAEALPGVEFNTNALLDQLLNEQCDDGSCPAIFPAEDPAEERVGPTLDGMLFMLRLCRAGGQ